MADQPKNEFVGFLVPGALDDVLRLQTLLQSTRKGALIRDILIQYAADNNWSVEDAIERYATHLYSQWNLRWREKMDFRSYMAQSAVNMKDKYKLPTRLSKLILERCKEQHKLNQSQNK